MHPFQSKPFGGRASFFFWVVTLSLFFRTDKCDRSIVKID